VLCCCAAADHAWRKHPIAKKELAATSSTLLNSLRQTTCTATKACLSGGGGSTIPASKNVVVQNAEVLPGAALAKMDGAWLWRQLAARAHAEVFEAFASVHGVINTSQHYHCGGYRRGGAAWRSAGKALEGVAMVRILCGDAARAEGVLCMYSVLNMPHHIISWCRLLTT
jgi:trimethylamine:corrinoid methyltransferase-like protein